MEEKMEDKAPTDTFQASRLRTMLNVEISNRQSKQRELREMLGLPPAPSRPVRTR